MAVTPGSVVMRNALPAGLPSMNAPASASVQQDLAIDRWWTHFGDADLDRLIEAALERNADLAVAAARLREARAQLDEARGAAQPMVDLQATSARARASAQSLGLPASRTGSSPSFSARAKASHVPIIEMPSSMLLQIFAACPAP